MFKYIGFILILSYCGMLQVQASVIKKDVSINIQINTVPTIVCDVCNIVLNFTSNELKKNKTAVNF